MNIEFCKTCHAPLRRVDAYTWKCEYCSNTYDDESVKVESERLLRVLLSEDRCERAENLRHSLYKAINAPHIDSNEIIRLCFEIKALLPDDFMANFYYTANHGTPAEICRAIRETDVQENAEHVESAVMHIARSMRSEYALPLQDLVERAYKNTDTAKFEQLSTVISDELVKVNSGAYETNVPRRAFIAYSSKDMNKVEELVEYLEANCIDCFVAARNLRHGRGAVQMYERAICEAIDNCDWIIFVSSRNSRSTECDALRIELRHVKTTDTVNAPAEFRKVYSLMPHKYKKNRIEYRLDNEKTQDYAEKTVSEFFCGNEFAYSPEEIAERIMNYDPSEEFSLSEDASKSGAVKYCMACGTELPAKAKLCFECGCKEFLSTYKEYEQANEIKELRRAKEEAEKKARDEAVKVAEAKAAEVVRAAAEKKKEELLKEAEKKAADLLEEKERLAEKIRLEEEKRSSANGIYEDHIKRNGILHAKKCHVCGGGLSHVGEGVWKCEYCRNTYADHDFWKIVNSNGGLTFPGSCDNDPDKYASYFNFRPYEDKTLGVGLKDKKNCPENVTVPSAQGDRKVVRLESEAFASCQSVKSVTLPEGITHIHAEAFSHCKSLEKVILPDSLTYIGEEAFSWCPSIAAVRIPNKVTFIGKKTFYFCPKLTSIIFDGTKEEWEGIEKGELAVSPTMKVSFTKESDLPENIAEEYNKLGEDYYHGRNGKEQNYEKAVEWLTKASDLGNASAQSTLGNCYHTGRGVERDYSRAFGLYLAAAEQNNPKGMYNLAYCFFSGEGTEKSYQKAAEWYLKSAELKYNLAQYMAGYCYEHGYGVQVDYRKAVGFYEKAAEQGLSMAQCALGMCYANGVGVDPDLGKAAELFRAAAEQGNAVAQYNLGYYYDFEIVPHDYEKAFYWYQKSADNGYANAQNSLGYCYGLGQGVEKDAKKSAEWYGKAAEQGHVSAQYSFASCYHHGNGLPQSYEKAAMWYERAAEGGDSLAQFTLALLYLYGEGVEKNIDKAVELFVKNARNGSEASKEELIALNRCTYCGAEMKGVFKKKCSVCGRHNDD